MLTGQIGQTLLLGKVSVPRFWLMNHRSTLRQPCEILEVEVMEALSVLFNFVWALTTLTVE